MPKILENIEEKIFYNVIELINKKGFNNTSMKEIADETGVAVGTLYNYFSNKEDLVFNVIKKSWEETFIKLDKVLNSNLPTEIKYEKFIIILYQEISKRKVVGGNLIQNNIIKEKKFNSIKTTLAKKFKKIFTSLNKENNSFKINLEQKRLLDTIVTTISYLAYSYPEDEKNIEFLKNFAKKLIK